MRTLICLALAGIFLLAGCARDVTKTTDKGLFNVKLSSTGEILKYGRNEVNVYITSAKGVSIENAQIDITPWMPEHGHGSPWPPAVFEQGNGLYKAVIFITMPGHWQLKIMVRKGDEEDGTVFDFADVKK